MKALTLCAVLALVTAFTFISCNVNDRPDELEKAESQSSPTSLLANTYPTTEDLYLLKNESKTEEKYHELDHLAYITMSRESYRKEDGTYDYGGLNADLQQTSIDTGLPVVRGDKSKMKPYLKKKLKSRYDELETQKLFAVADSVWNDFHQGRFNRNYTSWQSPSNSTFTQRLGYSSNK